MPRELERPASDAQHAEPFPARYWTQLTDVRVPGSADRIDLVLVGPSGVHVVIDRPGSSPTLSAADGPDTDLQQAVRRAAAATAAVADLLPLRYRHVVTSEMSLGGLTGTVLSFGEVSACSPDVLRQAWRHRARTVSTSEATVIARLLRDRLEPFPVEPAPRGRAWWRRRSWRWVIAGAAAITGVAAGVAATVGLPMP